MAKKINGQSVVLNCKNKRRGGAFAISANAFSGIKFNADYIVKGVKYYEDQAVKQGAIRSE